MSIPVFFLVEIQCLSNFLHLYLVLFDAKVVQFEFFCSESLRDGGVLGGVKVSPKKWDTVIGERGERRGRKLSRRRQEAQLDKESKIAFLFFSREGGGGGGKNHKI